MKNTTERTKILVMDIEVPERVAVNAHAVNRNEHLLSPEDIAEGPDGCCGDFKGAFREYLNERLCSDSIYVGVKVKIKLGNREPIWVIMKP